MTIPDYTPKDIKRFWKKVNKFGSIPQHMPELGNCWEWIASKGQFGHGQFWVKTRMYGSHCVSWELTNGKIPHDLWVLHKCDNPSCVNPMHLYVGTQHDNAMDMTIRERFAKKITSAQVETIRFRYATEKISQKKLADEYGLCQPHISDIVNNEKWKHI